MTPCPLSATQPINPCPDSSRNRSTSAPPTTKAKVRYCSFSSSKARLQPSAENSRIADSKIICSKLSGSVALISDWLISIRVANTESCSIIQCDSRRKDYRVLSELTPIIRVVVDNAYPLQAPNLCSSGPRRQDAQPARRD